MSCSASPSAPPDDSPFASVRLSVVVPCRNGAPTLARQLDALEAQQVTVACEVVVADNGSTDDSRAIAARYAGAPIPVKVADASGTPGINHARNAGVRASRGDFIVLCDADDVVMPGWLAAYWEAYQAGASIAGGSLTPVSTDGTPLDLEPLGLSAGPELRPWPRGANCGFSRLVFDRLGGFDEGFAGGGDEIEFFWRAQLRDHELIYVPAAGVLYSTRTKCLDIWQQGRGYGRGYARLYASFRSSGMKRSSVCGALWFWVAFPIRFLVALAFPAQRRPFLSKFGSRVGTVEGSVRFRVFCP